MNIYLKSIHLLAPFDNDVVQVFGGVPHSFWGKYGFQYVEIPMTERISSDVMCMSDSRIARQASHKLGEYTLSDFRQQTRPGDTESVYVFSVISPEEKITARTIEDILPDFKSFIQKRQSEGYRLGEVKTTVFPFMEGNSTESKDESKLMGFWAKRVQNIPYVDILFNSLIIGRHYPTVT